MIFRKKNNQLKQIDFCCLRLATRKYCKSKAMNCSDVIQKTEIGFYHQNLSYIMNWIGFNGQLQIHKTYLPKLNLKKYESICHKCDHESVSSLHLIEIFEI